uniref:Uncharacterized protein n=1 Tax=Arundo donax TaxID=35708 RepID=A0A0A8Y6J8_ARUDO
MIGRDEAIWATVGADAPTLICKISANLQIFTIAALP